jgi:hypothetical protein
MYYTRSIPHICLYIQYLNTMDLTAEDGTLREVWSNNLVKITLRITPVSHKALPVAGYVFGT